LIAVKNQTTIADLTASFIPVAAEVTKATAKDEVLANIRSTGKGRLADPFVLKD